MEPEQRQRIIGYFLEETQEYLELLEPGMDDLESALADEERINELYRAAHSIKGGAAMLELDGIQKVAYRLESSLKFMKANPVNTSREIEAKLLKGVLGIKRLVAEVRETQDNMTDASAAEVWGDIEPTFDALDQELQAQVDNNSSDAITEAGAAGDAAELPDLNLNLEMGDVAASNSSDLDELSWDDIDDLTNLGEDSTATIPQSPEATKGIDGLDALANLFDENPLEPEDSLALDQEATLPSAETASALELEDFDLDDLNGLETSLGSTAGQSDDAALDELLADPLLGDMLSSEQSSHETVESAAPEVSQTASNNEAQAESDFDDLFGEAANDAGDSLSLDFEDAVDTPAPSNNAGGLDDLDAELDALGLENAELSAFADDQAGDLTEQLGDLASLEGLDEAPAGPGDSLDLDLSPAPDLEDGLGLDAALDLSTENTSSTDLELGELGNSDSLDLDLSSAPELGGELDLDAALNLTADSTASADLDLGELLDDHDLQDSHEAEVSAIASDTPEIDSSGDFSAALDEELTEADTWVSEETEGQPSSSEDESSALDAGLPPTEDAANDDLMTSLSVEASEPSVIENDDLVESDALVDIVDFAAELDAELESDLSNDSTMDVDGLALDDNDLLNSLSGESPVAPSSKPAATSDPDDLSELDDFLESTELDLSENHQALGNLDDLLDEMASSEGPAQPSSDSLGDDFDDLDSLLGDAPAAAQTATPSTPAVAKVDNFSDMEKLLQGTESLAGPAASANRKAAASAPPAKTRSRSQRLREQSMRVPIKTLDNFNNLVGEMVVNRNSLEGDQERLKQSLEKLVDHTQKLSDVGQKLQDLYERSLLENALLNSRRKVMGVDTSIISDNGSLNLSASNPASNSAVGDLDDLELDKFTGFHTLSQDIIELIVRVRESASDIDFLINESLDQDTRNFRQTTSQLQEEVNRSRMVPFAQTADRLPRAVRDIAHKCGKSARLTIEGRDTLIDKMLIEQLHDPLTHLINNAVTHGIETQEERIMNGKSADGAIRLHAFYQGNQTVISVADDGAGIDPEQIKRKAIEKGLVRSEDAENLGKQQLYDFLFHAGFSTRSQADAFAGRGVGMDVVQTRLQELRGTVVIDSEIGKGTTFTIRLPLTLSITKALQCISNRARIAFPLDGVEDMFDIPKNQIVTDTEGNQTIQWRDMMLPVRELSELLKYNRIIGRSSVYAGNADDDMAALVILRSAGEYLAVNVDRAEGEMDIVIKQLEGPVPKPTGIAGATVLSDGAVMPIADVLELIDISKGRTRQGAAALWEEEEAAKVADTPADTTPAEPMVLIVDDSITVRELLSMSFAKAGYRVEQARDGQEAWEKLRSGLPCDLIFCDIEMPRMTGLELLEKLQEDDELKLLPMSMLTSRGADKHRQLAAKLGAKGYFTKPYLEEALLEAANRLLQGEVLLDVSTAKT